MPSSPPFPAGETRGPPRARRAPTGDLIWLSVNAAPVHDADGEMTGVVTAFADITAQRVHEENQLARESRLHAAQQLTGLAWWELDLRTGSHVWSDEMFRL